MANYVLFSFSHLCYHCSLHHVTVAIAIPVSVKETTTVFDNHFAALTWKTYFPIEKDVHFQTIHNLLVRLLFPKLRGLLPDNANGLSVCRSFFCC